MGSLDVQLLWWEGCPSTETARKLVRSALDELGHQEVDIRLVEIGTEQQARERGFIGSPTILVDNVDLMAFLNDEPSATDIADGSRLTCRLYRRRDGRISPTPDPADVREALTSAVRRRESQRSPGMTPPTSGATTNVLAIGQTAPSYQLPDTAGTSWSLGGPGDAPATVVVFTCNHCPYALAWHDRIADAARDYASQGVRFLAVNSNDGERYPHDSYEAMQQRVASEDWPMPYLHDASQSVARAFGAKTTPDVFVLDADGVLRYRGAPDAAHDDPGLRAQWLRDAVDAVISGEAPAQPETTPVGCTIKWKRS